MLVRAWATGTDVTVTFRRRARQIRKSYVPRREKVPREARPKKYVPRREKAPREAQPTNHDEGERGHCHR